MWTDGDAGLSNRGTYVMTENSDELSGHILRAWREYAGRTGSDVARSLFVVPGAVSQWESGDRGKRSGGFVATVRRYAAALRLERYQSDALVSFWQAAGSPLVAPSRVEWNHNYEAPAGPVWAWVRSRSDTARLAGAMRWDPFQFRFDEPAAVNGLLVQMPTSAPNPPLSMILSDPGWVDFGHGLVPEQVATRLGMRYVRAGTFVGPTAPWVEHSALDHTDHRDLLPFIRDATTLAKRLGLSWVLAHRGVGHSLDGAEVEATMWPGTTQLDEHGALVSQLLVLPAGAKEIREARGLSRRQAAEEATAYEPINPITAKVIEALEERGRIPSSPRALTRLDTVYHMDGRFGLDRVYDSRSERSSAGSRFEIQFPEYWRGPVWVQPRSVDSLASCTVELTWGPWRRRQRLGSGRVLTTRKATADAPPLQVRVPHAWNVVAGIGAIPTAFDVNDGWYPYDIPGAIRLISDGLRLVRQGMPADLRRTRG